MVVDRNNKENMAFWSEHNPSVVAMVEGMQVLANPSHSPVS